MKRQYSGKFVVRVEPELHRSLVAQAKQNGKSLNDICILKLKGRFGVQNLEDKFQRIKEQAKKVCGDALEAIYLFGSYARGEENTNSDVDVLIVVSNEVKVDRSLYRKWDAAKIEVSGYSVEPSFTTLPTRERASSLWFEIAIDGICLYAKHDDIQYFLAKVRRQILAGEVFCKYAHSQRYWIWEKRA